MAVIEAIKVAEIDRPIPNVSYNFPVGEIHDCLTAVVAGRIWREPRNGRWDSQMQAWCDKVWSAGIGDKYDWVCLRMEMYLAKDGDVFVRAKPKE